MIFKKYEEYRLEERKSEKSKKGGGNVIDKDGTFKEPSSTYRIFSRMACNFVMPTPPGRPIPKTFRFNNATTVDEKDTGTKPKLIEEKEANELAKPDTKVLAKQQQVLAKQQQAVEKEAIRALKERQKEEKKEAAVRGHTKEPSSTLASFDNTKHNRHTRNK